MAYSKTITTSRVNSDGDYLVEITETDAEATSEFEIVDLPSSGRILRYTAVLEAGAGTTVDPIVGSATNPAGITVILENGTAAATVDVTPEPPTYYFSESLFVRNKVDAGTNNTISTRILLRATFTR